MKLKVIKWGCAHFHREGLNGLLGVKDHIKQHDVLIAAPTKKAAQERLAELGFYPGPADLRVARGNDVENIVAVGLLEKEGTVLVAPMMIHFGHGVVEMRARDDLIVVAYARRESDARGGYVLERQGA